MQAQHYTSQTHQPSRAIRPLAMVMAGLLALTATQQAHGQTAPRPSASAPKATVVELTAGSDQASLSRYGQRVQGLLASINAYQTRGASAASGLGTDPGSASLRQVLDAEKFYSPLDTLSTLLVTLDDGSVEVPGIYVQRQGGNIYEFDELVLRFDAQGRLQAVRQVSQLQNYGHILNLALKADPQEEAKVRTFVEDFARAFNQRDTGFLGRVFAPDAIIISGTGRGGITTMRRNDRDAYIDRLQTIFRTNNRVSVSLREPVVYRHPDLADIFGVVMRQTWVTSSYSDEGYLSLTVDYRTGEPRIQVRFWQENPFVIGGRSGIAPPARDLSLLPAQGGSRVSRFAADGRDLSQILPTNQGVFTISIASADADLLNAEIFKRWIREGIFRAEGIRILPESVQEVAPNTLEFTFQSDAPIDGQALRTTLQVRATSLLNETEIPVELYVQRNNAFTNTVMEPGQEPPAPPSEPVSLLQDVVLTANTAGLDYRVFAGDLGGMKAEDATATQAAQVAQGGNDVAAQAAQAAQGTASPLAEGTARGTRIALQLLPGEYTAELSKEGFETSTVTFTVQEGQSAEQALAQVTMRKTEEPERAPAEDVSTQAVAADVPVASGAANETPQDSEAMADDVAQRAREAAAQRAESASVADGADAAKSSDSEKADRKARNQPDAEQVEEEKERRFAAFIARRWTWVAGSALAGGLATYLILNDAGPVNLPDPPARPN